MATRRLTFTTATPTRPTPSRTASKPSLLSISTPDNPASLHLQRVLGTTTISSNGFSHLAAADASCFAFLAGAGAVLATFDEQGEIKQRYFGGRGTGGSGVGDMHAGAGAGAGANGYAGGNQSPRRSNMMPRRDGVANPGSGLGAGLLGGMAENLQADSPGSRNGTGSNVKERTKAASCVCLSPNGRLLALGEIGHRPRILIFSCSTSRSASALPLASLSEHTFGVRCLAFSPNTVWLASLGDINNGFLYIWTINERTGTAALYASNRCTSAVRAMAWMGGRLITVGTRHVKIWRVESSSEDGSDDVNAGVLFSPLQTLQGRNCLLGSLLERTFTTVVAVAEGKAIVCTDQGEVCLLDDTGSSPVFSKIAAVDFPVQAVATQNTGFLLVAGDGGRLVAFKLKTLLSPVAFEADCPYAGIDLDLGTSSSIIGLAPIEDLLVTLDSSRRFQILKHELSNDAAFDVSLVKQLPAHGAAVLGAQALLPATATFQAAYLTWSAEGVVLFWNHDGVNVGSLQIAFKAADMEDDVYSNELKIVCAVVENGFLVSGDKHGWLRIHDIITGKMLCEIRAHLGEITDLANLNLPEQPWIASSGRDRMVQVFRMNSGNLELLQTLDEHVGVVTGILFTGDGSRLISYSSDRTIIIREDISKNLKEIEGAAFVANRTITLKSTPISAALDSENEDTLFVSTTDRRIQGYQVKAGRMVMEFKINDDVGGDSVMLNSIRQVSIHGYPVIAGVSSSDKSIRLYDDTGRLLAREYGPTEGMTGLAVFAHDSKPGGKGLVTVAADGTIFMWTFGPDHAPAWSTSLSANADASCPRTFASILAAKPPLRRILSASEVARLQRLAGAGAGAEGEPSKARRRSPERRSPERQLSRLSLLSTPRLDSSSPRTELRSVARDRERSPTAEVKSLRTAVTTAAGRVSPIRRGSSKADVMVANGSPNPVLPDSNINLQGSSPTTTTPSPLPTLASSDSRNVTRRGSTGTISTTIPARVPFSTSVSSPLELCTTLRLYRARLAVNGQTSSPAPGDVRMVLEELNETSRVVRELATTGNLGLAEKVGKPR